MQVPQLPSPVTDGSILQQFRIKENLNKPHPAPPHPEKKRKTIFMDIVYNQDSLTSHPSKKKIEKKAILEYSAIPLAFGAE